MGISTGAGIVVSQSFGARDRKGLSDAIGNCIALSVIATVVIMIVGPLVTMPLLTLLGTPVSIIDWCAQYLNIYLIGTMFAMITTGMNGYINAQGFPKVGMCSIIIGAVTNIILDPVFIFGLDMGVRGAALATIISQAISAIWVLKFLFGKRF